MRDQQVPRLNPSRTTLCEGAAPPRSYSRILFRNWPEQHPAAAPEVQLLGDRLALAADGASARQELAVQRSQVRCISENAPKSTWERGDLLGASRGMLPGRAGGSTKHYAFGLVRSSTHIQKARLNAFTFAPER